MCVLNLGLADDQQSIILSQYRRDRAAVLGCSQVTCRPCGRGEFFWLVIAQVPLQRRLRTSRMRRLLLRCQYFYTRRLFNLLKRECGHLISPPCPLIMTFQRRSLGPGWSPSLSTTEQCLCLCLDVLVTRGATTGAASRTGEGDGYGDRHLGRRHRGRGLGKEKTPRCRADATFLFWENRTMKPDNDRRERRRSQALSLCRKTAQRRQPHP